MPSQYKLSILSQMEWCILIFEHQKRFCFLSSEIYYPNCFLDGGEFDESSGVEVWEMINQYGSYNFIVLKQQKYIHANTWGAC